MIIIYKTPTCAYCKQVAKYLDHVGVPYQFEDAQGDTYAALAKQYGMTVPLVYNTDTSDVTIGYNIGKLRKVAGIA